MELAWNYTMLGRFQDAADVVQVPTVLGVLPLIISVDPLFYAMAVILGAGLIFGTVLTLGVVPVLYSILFRAKIPKSATASRAGSMR